MAKKRKKKIPLRTLLRRAHTAADKAFSIYIRTRDKKARGGKCLICGNQPIQCAFHVVRRGRKILRWNELNAIGTCHRCNYIEYRNPDISRAWYIRTFGVGQYLTLVDESHKDYTPVLGDLLRIIDFYKKKLAELLVI